MDLAQVKSILEEKNYKAKIIRNSDFEYIGESLENTDNLSLRFLINFSYFDKKLSTASALLVDEKVDIEKLFKNSNGGIIVCNNAKDAFYILHNYLSINTDFFGCDEPTVIHKGAQISSSAIIADSSVRIGSGVIIEDNVIIKSNVEISANSKICCGCILGADGVMKYSQNGKEKNLNHVGKLLIGKETIIMDNSVIQKGINPYVNTIIGDNVMIGSSSVISHGTCINENVTILDKVCVLGHCQIGSGTWIGSGSTIKNRLRIGRNVHISIGTVIIEDIEDYKTISGFFGIDRMKSLINYKRMKNS